MKRRNRKASSTNRYSTNKQYRTSLFPFLPIPLQSEIPKEVMQQKKTTKEEYQKCVNVVVEYINQHLGEEIDLKSLAKVSNSLLFTFTG